MCRARILIFSSSSSVFSAWPVADDAEDGGSAAAEALCRPTCSISAELLDAEQHSAASVDDRGSPLRRVSVAGVARPGCWWWWLVVKDDLAD